MNHRPARTAFLVAVVVAVVVAGLALANVDLLGALRRLHGQG